ncbi:DUF89 family protein [bacterium]|nr:DUF89 family protein [bacterium]
MKSQAACIPCILGQVLTTARAVADDEWLHRKVLEEVMTALPGSDWSRSPAELLTEALGITRKTLRAQDPFLERRREVLRELRSLADEVRARLATDPDPFALATTAAAAANAVDALALGSFPIAEHVRALMEKGFAQGSPSDLKAALEPASRVLYLLDNAGEAALDILLVGIVRSLGKAVTVVARRPGLLHDATPEDAALAGFSEKVLDTGQDGLLGASPLLCGPDFRSALEASDLVIAKGSASWETLSGEKREAVYLLHAKCDPVARALGVAVGDLVLSKT